MRSSPFIVAEISANHLGSKARAHTLIGRAADAGADAVKFQLYDPERLAPAGKRIESGPWAGRDMRDLYREAMTPPEWFSDLFAWAEHYGAQAFSSVFDVDGLAFLERLGARRYKIASFELVDHDLIRAVAATGKPLILSTGMATLGEIAQAVTAAAGCDDLTLLKCTSGYPAPVFEANLLAGKGFGGYTFGRIAKGTKWGYSDHTMSIGACAAAAALGATMIEAHFTLARADGGPDAAFSWEPDEFARMALAAREAAAAIGEARYGPTVSELPQLSIRGRTLSA